MKNFLICNILISLIAISGLLYLHPQQANAVPVSYNVTSLNIPFSSIALNTSATGPTVFVEGGYNGSITSIYEAHGSNTKLYYKLGYHPTLPITLDTFNNMTASASVASTQSLSITVPSGNNNVVLVVGISFDHTVDTDHNKGRMASVKIGTQSFTASVNRTVTCTASVCDSEIWYLYNPPTGAQTITITPASVTTYHMVAGVYAFHNLRGLAPIQATNSNTGTSVTPTLNITPTFPGNSWILDNLFSLQTVSPTASSNTREWIGKTATIMGASQYNNNPTIGGSNTLSWTTNNVLWANTAVELVPIQDQTTFNFNLYPATLSQSSLTTYRVASNGSSIYYMWGIGLPYYAVNHIDTNTGVDTHDFGGNVPQVENGNMAFGTFATYNHVVGYVTDAGTVGNNWAITGTAGNNTITSTGAATQTNQILTITGSVPARTTFLFNNNGTTATTDNPNTCAVNYIPTSINTPIDAIVCNPSIPAHANKFWYGLKIVSMGNYYTNSTLPFLTTIDASPYKAALTIPSSIYGIPVTDVRMIGHWNGLDYFLSYTSGTLKYFPMSQLNSLLAQNRALQPFIITQQATSGLYEFNPTSVNPSTKYSIKLYGLLLNTTINTFGMNTIPSGYTARFDTNNEHDVRTLDPRWINLIQQDYPGIYSIGSLFPIYLTVSNAPTDASLMITSQSQTINNLAGIWSLTNLDTSHTAEFDLPANTCVNIYVADNSVYPLVYSYQGNVCANGVNQKTVYYTNTLPTTFYTMRYGATSSYTPSSNALTTTVRSTIAPFTYNVLIRNSTGSITTNSTFTVNSTSDTHIFNVSSTAKPGALFISVPGTGTIYSSYLGSALSFASTVSFFHQYFSYQGFDLLSFIPIIFASMFTRNTVGMGMAMVTVLIATLSFLSVVVISDATMGIIVVISLIGLIGYRGLYG